MPLVLGAPGVVVSVDASDDQTRRHVESVFTSLRLDHSAPVDVAYVVRDRGRAQLPSRWVVHRDGEYLLDASTLAGAVDVVLTDLDELVIDRNLDTALVVHASAVEVGGRVVVMPGASGSGKTTLCAALVAAGASYVTDEAVVLRADDQQVAPYLRPLCIKPGSRTVVAGLTGAVPETDAGTWHLPPGQLGGLSSGGRPAAVVLPRYDPAAGAVEARPLSRGQALMAVADSSSYLAQQGPRMLPVLAAAVTDAACVELRYADVEAAADCVLDLLA